MSQPPTCPICYYAYDDELVIPKLLSCGNHHSVCHKCLAELLKTSNPKCPLCQASLQRAMSCFRDNNDIIDSFNYIKRVQERECLSSCSKCHLQGDEEMFVVCSSCFNNGSLAEVDLKALCVACFSKCHKDHETVPLVEMRAMKTAEMLRSRLVSYTNYNKTIGSYISEILPYLTESESLSNSLADMAEHARSSKILKKISKTFDDDTKYLTEAIKKFQDEMVLTFLTLLKNKIQIQKIHIKSMKAFCTVQKEVPKKPEVQFQIISSVFLIFALLKLLFIHLTTRVKKEKVTNDNTASQ
ncbi:unnamed protein product [Auanema sp. JU1783]|nr:unnamed protein product [Auanema sp. JU1783]